MVRYKILIFFFISLFLVGTLYPQKYPNPEVNKLLEVGIEYILNQNYTVAKAKFTTLQNKYPEIPLGKIYLAVVDITKAFDYGEEVSPSVSKELNEAIEISENLLENNPSNIWNHYFVALSKGYRSYLSVLNGEWLSAISSGVSSVQYFEDCLELDSSFYEAFVALGTYKFWKSRKLEFLEWLPFFDDESEVGINLLELALTKTSYNRNLAAISLIWIYIENKNYLKAIQIAEKELKKNPINRTLQWALARAYENINPHKSIQLYAQLIVSYKSIPDQNHYHEITLKHIIAQQCVNMGENREALRLCEEILSENRITEAVREKLSDRLKRVKNLKKELKQ